jgi:chromate reductase, NAD(P)H dehydrogenase (quinone)
MAQETPLHFVVMVGSLRKASFNAAIGEFPHYDADLQAEGVPPVVTRAAEAIRAADGVIIVTPEYNHTIPGVLKNAIDWISRLPNQPFAAKPVALESASQGLWGGGRSSPCGRCSSISTAAS